ncbi:unnamed protein product, partial [marine sediment metagenome]
MFTLGQIQRGQTYHSPTACHPFATQTKPIPGG